MGGQINGLDVTGLQLNGLTIGEAQYNGSLVYQSLIWELFGTTAVDTADDALKTRLAAYDVYPGGNGFYSITELPFGIDATQATVLHVMFLNDYLNLMKVNLRGTSNVYDWGSAFDGCYNLREINGLDMSSSQWVAAMFKNCQALVSLPPIDASGWLDCTDTFLDCRKLKHLELNGLTRSVDVSDTDMDADDLNLLFESIGTVSTPTDIIVSGTPGATTCDKTIAEAKGWKVLTGLYFYDSFNRGSGSPGSNYTYEGLRPDIWDNRVGGGYNSSSTSKTGAMVYKQSAITSRYRVDATVFDGSSPYPVHLMAGSVNSDGTGNYAVGLRIKGQTTLTLYLSWWDRGGRQSYVYGAASAGDTVGFSYDTVSTDLTLWVNGQSVMTKTVGWSVVLSKKMAVQFESSSSASSAGIDDVWFYDF